MIRGIFSVITKCVTPNLLRSYRNSNGFFQSISNPVSSQHRVNFTSSLHPIETKQLPFQFITKIGFLKTRQTSLEQTRTVIKFSYKKAKRKTVRTVVKRFYRLNWGIWIRTMAGKNRLWAKKPNRRKRLLSHVFCNATQSTMLDKMTNRFWKRPKYYIDDPYAPYHTRENFTRTRKRPWRPEGVDYE